ncbi:hypothetical protein B0O99DRAFT_640368 [Bisporella sp. PMI_857]|nr:hypothetical protein B0O99DRAFT_640368 [Bisporella sp. PMI_857]
MKKEVGNEFVDMLPFRPAKAAPSRNAVCRCVREPAANGIAEMLSLHVRSGRKINWRNGRLVDEHSLVFVLCVVLICSVWRLLSGICYLTFAIWHLLFGVWRFGGSHMVRC